MAEEQLSFIIADLHRFTAAQTRALALDVQANLQEDTPRDTGWARANWVMALGAPADDPTIAAITDPTPAQVSQAVARQQTSEADVLTYDDVARGPIFTSNNVPYIGALNAGHSPQATAGFVQRAVADAINFSNVARGTSFRPSRDVENVASAFPRRR